MARAGLNSTREVCTNQCPAHLQDQAEQLPAHVLDEARPSAIRPAVTSIRSCQRRVRSLRVATLSMRTAARLEVVPCPVVNTCTFVPPWAR